MPFATWRLAHWVGSALAWNGSTVRTTSYLEYNPTNIISKITKLASCALLGLEWEITQLNVSWPVPFTYNRLEISLTNMCRHRGTKLILSAILHMEFMLYVEGTAPSYVILAIDIGLTLTYNDPPRFLVKQALHCWIIDEHTINPHHRPDIHKDCMFMSVLTPTAAV